MPGGVAARHRSSRRAEGAVRGFGRQGASNDLRLALFADEPVFVAVHPEGDDVVRCGRHVLGRKRATGAGHQPDPRDGALSCPGRGDPGGVQLRSARGGPYGRSRPAPGAGRAFRTSTCSGWSRHWARSGNSDLLATPPAGLHTRPAHPADRRESFHAEVRDLLHSPRSPISPPGALGRPALARAASAGHWVTKPAPRSSVGDTAVTAVITAACPRRIVPERIQERGRPSRRCASSRRARHSVSSGTNSRVRA